MHDIISQPMFLDEIGKPVGIVPGENSVVHKYRLYKTIFPLSIRVKFHGHSSKVYTITHNHDTSYC